LVTTKNEAFFAATGTAEAGAVETVVEMTMARATVMSLIDFMLLPLR
jgi:hypothetical protein